MKERVEVRTQAELDAALAADKLPICIGNGRTYHTLDSRGSAAGFPDIVALRGTRMVMAELKREKGRVTDAQQAWLDDLAKVETLETFLWRPADWPQVEEALR